MELKFFQTLVRSPDYRDLLTNAAHIGERYIESLPVLLFQQGSQYIEVVFSRNGYSIVASRTFSDTEDLDPYLGNISVPDFF